MDTDKTTSQKRTLRWVMAVGLVLFLVGNAAIVGIFLWQRGGRAQRLAAEKARANSAMANWSAARFSIQSADGVHQTSARSWSVKGGRAFMQVRRKEDDSLEVRFAYPFDGLVPPETIALVQTRWGISQVEKFADELSITPEQLAALKAVSPATDIPVPAPERQRLRDLFEDYLAAGDKEAAEKGLIEAVTAVDTNYFERTLQRIDGIAEKVKGIFNEDQLAALTGRFGPHGHPR
jgi:hypothetical protein